MLTANKVGIDEAARVTGLKPDDIRKAVTWIAEPKQGGARRRTMFAYEKGLIWGNDNYPTNAALVNIALATGNPALGGWYRYPLRAARMSAARAGDASAWAAIRRVIQTRLSRRRAGSVCRSAVDQRQRGGSTTSGHATTSKRRSTRWNSSASTRSGPIW
jgi:hypothetical protein